METKDLRLTLELKEKLAGCLGFTVNAAFPYVLKKFRQKNKAGQFTIPKEFWPLFTLKSLDGLEAAKREDASGYMTLDNVSKESQLHIESGSARVSTLEKGILQVKNYYFEDGTFVDFNSEAEILTIHNVGKVESKRFSVNDFIRFLRVEVQLDLQEAINERSTLTEDELRGLEF